MFINSYDKVKAVEEVDSQPFKIGTKLVVKAGAIEDRAPTTTVFDGQVAAVDADFGHGGITLGVRAYDLGHRLMRNRKARVFKKQAVERRRQEHPGSRTASACRSTPAARWTGSSRTTRPTGTSSGGSPGRSTTGCSSTARPVKFVRAGKYRADHDPARVAGHDRVLPPARDRRPAGQNITASAWDPISKKAVGTNAAASKQPSSIGLGRAKVSADLGGGAIHISNSSATSQDELNKLAQGTLDRIATAYVEAEAHIPGNPAVKAGVTLDVKGVGQQFSGKYVWSAPCATRCPGGGAFDTHVSTANVDAQLAGGAGRAATAARRSSASSS